MRKPTSLPREFEDALQALAYWIAYQQARYWHYPLSEGAIVDELVRLLSEKLGRRDGLVVVREQPVAGLPGNERHGATRFDLAVGTPGPRKKVADPAYCIEVKRAGIGYKKDLLRLLFAMTPSTSVWRGFVVVVDDARPEFLTGKGGARRGMLPSSDDISFVVRRVVRAHGALQARTSSGHWVCALEVVRNTQ